jgi:PadR family transcriptional regulator, regulatory protein AphA
MNTLAYGLLSLIAISPCTGYDLTQRIQLFWNANHSQIYPLLAQLEEMGYVQFEHVAQTDKPDKKIYTLTDEGKAEIRRWIPEPTDPPVIRDEFALKVLSLWLVDQEGMKKLLDEREQVLVAKLERLHKKGEELRKIVWNRDATSGSEWPSPFFGASLRIQKSIGINQAELDWCRGIKEKMASSSGCMAPTSASD